MARVNGCGRAPEEVMRRETICVAFGVWRGGSDGRSKPRPYRKQKAEIGVVVRSCMGGLKGRPYKGAEAIGRRKMAT
jgi:hypothetical protein